MKIFFVRFAHTKIFLQQKNSELRLVKIVINFVDTRPDWIYFSYIQDAGRTALSVASAADHTEVVDLLISRGATVDYQGQVHEAPVSSHVCIILVITACVLDEWYINIIMMIVLI